MRLKVSLLLLPCSSQLLLLLLLLCVVFALYPLANRVQRLWLAYGCHRVSRNSSTTTTTTTCCCCLCAGTVLVRPRAPEPCEKPRRRKVELAAQCGLERSCNRMRWPLRCTCARSRARASPSASPS